MRKKLGVLVFALLAAALANSVHAASASICPSGTRIIVCQHMTGFICCPDNALCAC